MEEEGTVKILYIGSEKMAKMQIMLMLSWMKKGQKMEIEKGEKRNDDEEENRTKQKPKKVNRRNAPCRKITA